MNDDTQPTAERETAETAAHVRGSSLLVAGRLLSVAISLGTQALIARQLSQTEFGAFALALAIAALGQVAITLGLHRGATRFLTRYQEEGAYPRLLGTIVLNVTVILGLGAILVVLVAAARTNLTDLGLLDPAATGLLLILVLLAPIDALDDLLIALFAVFDSPRSIFFRRYVLGPSLRLAVAALLVLADGDSQQLAVGYLLTGLFSTALYGALFVRLLDRRGILDAMRRQRLEIPAREVIASSVPLLSNDAVWLLINTLPIVVLTAASGLSEVAAYQVVRPAAALNLLVSTSFAVLYQPMAARLAARADKAGASRLYWRSAIWVAVMTFPIFAATFALGRPLAGLLFGERYESSGSYLSILAAGYLVHAALGFNGATLAAHGHHRAVAVANGITAAASVVGALLLIPPFGALGAAVAAAATLVVQNGLLQFAVRRQIGIPFLPREALRVYAVIAVAGGVLFLVATFGSVGLWTLVFAAAAFGIVLYLARDAMEIDTLFPEIHPVLLRMAAMTGMPGRRLIAGLDLLRSTHPRVAFGRIRTRRQWAAQAGGPRREVYRRIWTEAASAIGAEVVEVAPGTIEIRSEGRRVLVTDHTLAIDPPVTLARALDKPAVSRLLEEHGLPVADQVEFGIIEFERASAFLVGVGGPCVVKPADGATGSGVTTQVRSRADLLRAIIRAGGVADRLVIERQVAGLVYRLLFLDGELLDIIERRPPRVVGDGRSTIGRLVDQANERRLAADGRDGLSLLKVDLECVMTLRAAGLGLGSVPAAGVVVEVKTATNQNGARDNRSVFGDVSVDLVDRAREAAAVVGVRLAGVDVITADAHASLRDTGGVIIEVNGLPGIHYHYLVHPDSARRPVALPILELLLLQTPEPVTALAHPGSEPAIGAGLG